MPYIIETYPNVNPVIETEIRNQSDPALRSNLLTLLSDPIEDRSGRLASTLRLYAEKGNESTAKTYARIGVKLLGSDSCETAGSLLARYYHSYIDEPRAQIKPTLTEASAPRLSLAERRQLNYDLPYFKSLVKQCLPFPS